MALGTDCLKFQDQSSTPESDGKTGTDANEIQLSIKFGHQFGGGEG